MLDDFDTPSAVSTILDQLTEYENHDAAGQVLIGFIEQTLKNRAKAEHVDDALDSLEEITGKKWVKNRSSTPAEFREAAKAAIA